MRHRIFIAINLPEDVKKQLIDYQSKWLELPCRWTKKENLHITLMFLGYLSDEELLGILKIAKEVVSRNSSFLINLKKICYGPPKKMPPRMVWAEGEKSEELGKLQKDLENSLFAASISESGNGRTKGEKRFISSTRGLKPDVRPYTAHITLGRIRAWEFRQIEPEEKPIVEEEISLNFEVNSIEIMESQLKRGGSEYSVLESYSLPERSEGREMNEVQRTKP